MCEPLALEKFGLLSIPEVDPEHLLTFTCGQQNLDDYLRNCRSAHEERVSHTTVVFHESVPEGPVGYFTLSNDGIKLKTSEEAEYGLSEYGGMSSYPAVKLGRFAIASAFQGKGIGAQMISIIEGEILGSRYLSAARLLVVDAANRPEVLAFYRKNGFESSLWAEDQARNHGPKLRGNIAPEAVKMIKDILRR